MAGDWIKMRSDLIDDPDVYLLSEELSIDVPTIVGHLYVFWSWIDKHTVDGLAIKITETMIDKKIGVTGFASSLKNINWLSGNNMSLEIPNFDRHNSNSAKARALESEAKRIRREIKNDKKDVGQVSDKNTPKSTTREEKRREDIKNTPTPPTEFRENIPKNFYPSDEVIEYAKARKLPNPLDQALLDEFINTNESSNWTSANWQSELKKFLPKWKVKNETNKSTSNRKLSAVEQVELDTAKQKSKRDTATAART